VALCGHLPLAIALLARLLSRHQSWTIEDLIEETKARLLTVTAENRTIAAAFELPYQYLTAGRQRFFRQLSLHPGADLICMPQLLSLACLRTRRAGTSTHCTVSGCYTSPSVAATRCTT
jgi:hypothetical protein